MLLLVFFWRACYDLPNRVKLATSTIAQVQVPGLGTAPGIVISGGHWQLQWALSEAAVLFQFEAGK